MTKTNFKNRLHKVQELQVLAFEHGLNFEFGTRNCNADGKEYLVGLVFREGVDLTKDKDCEGHLYFNLYQFETPQEHDATIAHVEDWILTHTV